MDITRDYYLAFLVITVVADLVNGAPPPGRLPTTADPCLPNPCQNRALCRSRGDGYSCFCVPGFQGARCQIDVNECVSQPCLNGASCEDGVGRYTCVCPPGFAGSTCQLQVDKCQSQPCLNGGSCHDTDHGVACTCLPGFHGDHCENNTDECQSGPCQNGAPCEERQNDVTTPFKHSCACTGQNCLTPVPPCQSQPCFNSALCQDKGRNYTCKCRPGSLCQELVDPCQSSPCQNGGHCEAGAGGYACHCLAESTGGGDLYGGARCHVALAGCEGHPCQNGGGCRPVLSQDERTHGHSCSCPPGFTGPLCQTPTTFSFLRSGYLLLQGPPPGGPAACHVTLSLRTALPRTLLFQRGGGGSGGPLLSLELQEGRPRLTLRMEPLVGSQQGGSGEEEGEEEVHSQTLELQRSVADGEWHSVEVLLGNGTLGLALLGDIGGCRGSGAPDCRATASVAAGLGSTLEKTFFGGVPGEDPSNPADADRPPAFVGCMRDVLLEGRPVGPQEWLSDSAVEVSPGCSHRDRCLDTPCLHGGHCTNLWQSHRCRCPRPYEGPDCGEEYQAARFGSQNSLSYAVFSVTDHLGQDLSVSLFLRTRQKAGLLLALAQGGEGGGGGEGGHPYLRMWLEGGTVNVQVNGSERLRSRGSLGTGEVHLVSVEVVGGAGGDVTLFVGDQKQGSVPLGSPLEARAGDRVYVGGLQEEGPASAFRGCLQDLRINDRRLQFFRLEAPVRSYPMEALVNVSAGCSGDDACSGDPCLNGGLCLSTWDHFNCTCPSHTAGRRCEQVSWCEASPCPAGSECRALQQGYECFSNVTLLKDSSFLTYRGNGRISRDISSLTLSLRTRRRHAVLLYAERGSAFLNLSLQDGLLTMELLGGGSTGAEGEAGEESAEASVVSLASRRPVSDGAWHSARLFRVAPRARRSRWTLVLDEDPEEASTSAAPGAGGSLNFLRRDVDIFLGGLGPAAGWGLVGCLGPMALGGVALPYFNSSQVGVARPQEEQFVLTSAPPPRLGCAGEAVCDGEPCLNGGRCRDLFHRRRCDCTAGWAGPLCDASADPCAAGPCVHGNCSARGGAYECACEPGYAGARCSRGADVCEGHMCAHGATCLHGPGRYACLCAANYTGPLCNERVQEVPWYIVVRNIPPKLPVSICGDSTRNYTCFNGGNCTDRELSCVCLPGFTGHRCEQELDECRSNPCLNGGYCRNLINKFTCMCDMSFAGDRCQTDADRAPPGSRLAAVLAPCLVALAIVLLLAAALGFAKLRERRQTSGSLPPQRLEEGGRGSGRGSGRGGNHVPPGVPGGMALRTLAARVERLLTAGGLASTLLLPVGLLSALLVLVLVLSTAGLVVALNRRATHGAYSPSRQEKEGSRVEMWNITQPPPMERLI